MTNSTLLEPKAKPNPLEEFDHHYSFPDSYAEFCSDGAWKAYGYLKYIARRIEESIADGNGRLIIEAPPRHGKSFLISYWLPLWYLHAYPEKRIILSTYGDDFAGTWGKRVFNEAISNPLTKIPLKSRFQKTSDFETQQGGGMLSVGVGGMVMGRGGHLLIVDDPIKNLEEAMSETIRQKTYDWFAATLKSRLEPKATIIILMTRWHEYDIVGQILENKGEEWERIRLPAMAEENDPMGRKVGEALCPERFNLEDLERIKKAMPRVYWNALYQQRPSATVGNIFLRTNWRHWDKRTLPPLFEDELISMDTNAEEGADNDFTTIGHWGKVGANFYLLDQVKGQWSMGQQLTQFKMFCDSRPRAFKKLIEKKTNGPAIHNLLKKSIPGIILVEPLGSKEQRANAVEPFQTAGNIFIPADEQAFPWVDAFEDECASFPKGKNDDQVDQMTQAINHWQGFGSDFLDKITRQ